MSGRAMILGPDGRPVQPARVQRMDPPEVRTLRARFDAAQTTDENSRHWGYADGLSADAAASPGIRRTLRNRSRYEVANNSYARGIVSTIANDCIGTGPRLQLYGTGISRKDASFVEGLWAEWCEAADIAEKLRTMRMAASTDGEGFGLIINNPEMPTPVQLDLRLIEAEQCTNPIAVIEPDDIDGIAFDMHGNPVRYRVLKYHPGGIGVIAHPLEYDDFNASKVVHLYRPERPGQRRGIPELTPALPLFAQLRRWTLSVIAAAETAADFAAIMYTDQTPEELQPGTPFDRIEIERRAMMSLPDGYKMAQLKAEHPTSTYQPTKHELINEIARAMNIPFNIAAGNSAGYNYSSGRLDDQIYHRQMRVDRQRVTQQVLARLFRQWVRESVLIEGLLPQSMRRIDTDWAHRWMWDGQKHIDPLKEANAQTVRLKNLTTTLADELAVEGKDWEDHIEQVAKERKKLAELGLSLDEVAPAAPAEPDEDEDDGAVEATILRDESGRIIGATERRHRG